ncbi:prohibitin family protein [Halobacillus rhizosphaerae]|uniref:prohibitin family protein n=1 Tax=Halobacillus rhizosphaerae TaxID=3064889 RepID=UPI00398AE7C0
MSKLVAGLVAGVVIFVMLIVGWFSFTATINQGHAGVVYSRSHGVEDHTLSQGLHFVNPMKRITEYPVSTETINYDSLSLATKDGKPLSVNMTVEYYNNVDKLPYIYNKFKGQKPKAIEDSWLKARMNESALEVTSKYTILEVFQKREEIRTEIFKKFKADVKPHGFEVENVVFGTPHPDKNTQKAIQAVVDAQQDVEKIRIQVQKAKLEAEKKKVEAEGTAKAQIEQARGEAEANRLVQQSITPELLKKMEMEARMKHGWVEIQGANTLVEAKK